MEESDEIKKQIENNHIRYLDGSWYICELYLQREKIKKNDDPLNSWGGGIDETSHAQWKKTKSIPDAFTKSEWFQIKVLEKDPNNIKYIKDIASDKVWQFLLSKYGGQYIRYLKPETAEMQKFAREIDPENIRYFSIIRESDAKTLLSLPNHFVGKDNGGWCIHIEGKKLCDIPLNRYFDKKFFYQNAYKYNSNYANTIADLAVNNEPEAISFVLEHSSEKKFKRCIAELAKRNENALKIVSNNPKEYQYYILDLAKNNIVWAKNYVISKEDLSGCLELAKGGDKNAEMVVRKHPECFECWFYLVDAIKFKEISELHSICDTKISHEHLQHIITLAKEGDDEKAIAFLCKHYENKECWECVLDCASKKNKQAVELVLRHTSKEGARKCIVDLAYNGIKEAKNFVFKCPNDPQFLKCIIFFAEKRRDEDACKIIYERFELPECWSAILNLVNGWYWPGLKHARDVVLKHLDKEGALEYAVQLACDGLESAKKIVEANYLKEECRKSIIEKKYSSKYARNFIDKHPEIERGWKIAIKQTLDGDKNAFATVIQNLDKPDCRKFVEEEAKKDPEKIKLLLLNSEKRGVIKYIVAFAQEGDKNCKKFVLEHSQIRECRHCIMDLASKDNDARDFLFNNSGEKDFLNCIAYLAERNYSDCISFVLRHPDKSEFEHCIVKLAPNNMDARNIVLNNPHRPAFEAYLVEMTLNGDEEAKACLESINYSPSYYGNYHSWLYARVHKIETNSKRLDYNKEREYWQMTVESAIKGVKYARKAVLNYPELDICWNCIVKLANKDDDVKNYILEHPDKLRDYSCIIEWAKGPDKERALNIVFQHPKDVKCRKLIKESAASNDLARKAFLETVQFTDDIEEVNRLARSGYKDAEEVINRFLTENDVEKKRSIWRIFLKDNGLSERAMDLPICSFKTDYYGYNQMKLRAKAKEIATGFEKDSSKISEKTWKDVLRKKGITEDQMKLNDFSFKSSYESYRPTDLEKIANMCIVKARKKKII